MAAALGTVALVVGVVLVTGALELGGEAASGDVVVAEEAPVTAMDQGVGWANNSPSLVADPDDDRFVVMANRRRRPSSAAACRSPATEGGRWLTAYPVPQLPDGMDKCYAPEVAFDRDGAGCSTCSSAWPGAGNEPDRGLPDLVHRPRPHVQPSPARCSAPTASACAWPSTGTGHGRQRAHPPGVDRGQLPIRPWAGAHHRRTPIVAAHSDDGGVTFSHARAGERSERHSASPPALALGPDHAVHVAYYDLQDDAVDYQGLEGRLGTARGRS